MLPTKLLAQTIKNDFGLKIPTGYGNNEDTVLGQCLLGHPVHVFLVTRYVVQIISQSDTTTSFMKYLEYFSCYMQQLHVLMMA